MKKLMETLAFALVAIAAAHAAETTIVDYGQTSETTIFNLIWEYETRSSGGVTNAVITGVRDSGSAYISGSISVPTSVSETPNGTGYIVKEIADGAFEKCSALERVRIPDSVTSIDIKAFEECGSLILRVYNGTEGAAYAGRELLKHELLPNEDDFVMNGTAIVKYTGWIGYVLIPDTVTSIEDGAFKGCKALHSVTIPASVTSIGKRAFRTGSFLSGSCELTLRVYPDTEGERYAKANDIKYELIK
jgi:hypothetical protein